MLLIVINFFIFRLSEKLALHRFFMPKFSVFAVLVFAVVLCVSVKANAQIFFYQMPGEEKEKAARSGFVFENSFGNVNDSMQLVFHKQTDAQNKLTCYFDRAGFCYRFGYTLPAKSVVEFTKNLTANFTRRASGLWESREKKFLLRVEEKGEFTVVTYLPYVSE